MTNYVKKLHFLISSYLSGTIIKLKAIIYISIDEIYYLVTGVD